MNSTKGSVRARLLTSTLLAGLASVAAPLAITAIAMAVPTLAAAQDYTSGTLIGTVTDSAGNPISGAAVTVKSKNTGLARSFTTAADGGFRLPLVQLGEYGVSISKDGYEPIDNSSASVRLGGESAYAFSMLKPGEVSAVVVTGTANPQIDFAATTTGLSIDLETLAKRVPLPRTIAGITLLAPGAVAGSQYANSANGARIAAQPALGGSSSAENAYYINGLNITNFATYLGGATVPFDFYKTVEVKTGGYAPEFGRATGGIISAVTKSGGNDFHFRVSGNYEPQDLRDDAPSTVFYKESRRDSQQENVTFEASGPIIEDHLFFYALNTMQKSFTSLATNSGSNDTYTTQERNDPFWGVKLDGYITDRHHVELTWFDTTRQTDATSYGYVAKTDTVGALLRGTRNASTNKFNEGGASWVAKYTGSLTDWFTVSAAYGISEDSDSTLPGDTTTPYISDSRGIGGLPAQTRIGTQTTSATSILETRREFYRFDGDLYFELLGKHHVRAGYDNEKTSLFRASVPTGGVQYELFTGSSSDAYNQPAGQDYVKTSVFVNGGTFDGENSAWYVQDSWDVLPNLNLQLGLRGDKFLANNPVGETFIEFSGKDTLGPRVGFNWDVFDDSSTKVSGSFGRYYLPVAANTAYRMTSGELYYSKFFKVSNVNAAAGTFTQGAQISGFATAVKCPDGSSTNACEVTGDGTPADVSSFINQKLKPTYEDEYILGIERQFNPLWKAGARIVYRNLGETAEDSAIDAAVLRYCAANGIQMTNATQTGCSDIYSGFHQYVITNPGSGMTVILSDVLPGDTKKRTLTFTASELGYPKVKREYIGLEMTFERAFDGKWGLQGSYVVSESKGNYEGAVKSDVGQLDFAITQDFDQPALTENAYGLLPNHRGHQFKAFGSYAFTDNLMMGVNVSVLSPKKYGCLGRHPTDVFAQVYGASSFYCITGPGQAYKTQSISTPRGSQFESDWRTQLDLNFKYNVPKFGFMPGDLSLHADVFNVFNSQAVVARFERAETSGGAWDSRYKTPTGYQTPRYVRFGFDWAF